MKCEGESRLATSHAQPAKLTWILFGGLNSAVSSCARMGQWPVVCLAMIVIMGFHTWPGLEKFDGFRLQFAHPKPGVSLDACCKIEFGRMWPFVPSLFHFVTFIYFHLSRNCSLHAWGHTIQQLVLQAGSMEKFTVKLHSCMGDCCIKDGWSALETSNPFSPCSQRYRPSCLGCFFGHDPHVRQCRTGPWCCEHVDFCSL